MSSEEKDALNKFSMHIFERDRLRKEKELDIPLDPTEKLIAKYKNNPKVFWNSLTENEKK